MGMLGKLFAGTLLSKAARRYEDTRGRREVVRPSGGQYIPANDLDVSRTNPGRGGAIVGRATQFYRDNPTLVHALAATAGAVLLTRMRRR